LVQRSENTTHSDRGDHQRPRDMHLSSKSCVPHIHIQSQCQEKYDTSHTTE
jgi:hypothetical protein